MDSVLDSPRDFTMDDLSKMNYLEWCIKESLRLYPSVPWYGRALTEDTEFCTLINNILHTYIPAEEWNY